MSTGQNAVKLCGSGVKAGMGDSVSRLNVWVTVKTAWSLIARATPESLRAEYHNKARRYTKLQIYCFTSLYFSWEEDGETMETGSKDDGRERKGMRKWQR